MMPGTVNYHLLSKKARVQRLCPLGVAILRKKMKNIQLKKGITLKKKKKTFVGCVSITDPSVCVP